MAHIEKKRYSGMIYAHVVKRDSVLHVGRGTSRPCREVITRVGKRLCYCS